MILGIDEVGRGPWAGPLVVGAVILGCEIDGITDSKKLSAKRREELSEVIINKAQAVALGWVEPSEIDTLGLGSALELACKRALEVIDTQAVAYHEIIIDGTVNFLKHTSKGKFVTTMKKADLLIPSVGAASIVAKVARDAYMKSQDDNYPAYGFGAHAGYGTAQHRVAIERHGVTPLHRLSFAPLKKYRIDSSSSLSPPDNKKTPSTKQMGDTAETVAASYLEDMDHTILERNWRTKYCEIDIVSRLGDTLYFVEVKHRKTDASGAGLDMITSKKLEQMRFAAKLYVHARRKTELNLSLAAIATTGLPPTVTDFIDSI